MATFAETAGAVIAVWQPGRASSAEGTVGHCHPAERDPRGKRRTIGYGPAWAGREDGCP
jgi:hypothetical protein